jgi:hypothetical protein
MVVMLRALTRQLPGLDVSSRLEFVSGDADR